MMQVQRHASQSPTRRAGKARRKLKAALSFDSSDPTSKMQDLPNAETKRIRRPRRKLKTALSFDSSDPTSNVKPKLKKSSSFLSPRSSTRLPIRRRVRRVLSFKRDEEEITLPERSILSGKGSEDDTKPCLIRMLSERAERSLVKKISQSIQQDLSVRTNQSMESSGPVEEQPGSATSITADDEDSLTLCISRHSSLGESKVCVYQDSTTRAIPVPSLHRNELELGDLLGQGAFSKVFAVEGIKLMSQKDFDKRKNQCQQEETTTEALATSMRQSLVEESSSSSQLVVKHLNRKLLQKPKEFQHAALDLACEANILASINGQCKHIIQLRALSLGGTAALDSGRFNNFFLVLDRLEDTLDARIERWKEDPAANKLGFFYKATQYAIQLASALEFLHARRLVFRDTKPQNVGFHNDTLQLFDFGLCRPLPSNKDPQDEDDTFPMNVAGTVRYMSPECMQQDPYNCKTDVYSFAVTFYEMLFLQKPYGEILKHSQFREYICVMGKRPNLKDLQLPQSVEQLLKDAWCASISQRLSMRQVKERLERILVELKPTESDDI